MADHGMGRPNEYIAHAGFGGTWTTSGITTWRLREVPEMTAYDVQGPVWDPGAWKRVTGEGD